MPNLTTIELAVVAACFLFFWVVPALLNTVHQRRRRLAEAVAAAAGLPPQEPIPAPTAGVQDAFPAAVADSGARPALVEEAEGAPAREAPAAAPPAPWAEDEWREPTENEVAVAADRTTVRLGDLRRASLGNWPPEAVRNNPSHAQRWLQAERLAARHAAALEGAELVVPRPVRACCFAGGEETASVWQLRFLLFSELWPEQEDQAEALALFELGSESEPVRVRVAVRRR